MTRFRSYLLLTIVGAASLSCVGDSSRPVGPTAPVTPPADPSLISGIGGLLNVLTGTLTTVVNDLLPILFVCRDNGGPYTGSTVIDARGGMLYFGPHWLSVPPGALTGPTRISARSLAGDTIAVDLQPHGLQFQKPAMLALNYSHCSGWQPDSLQIQYVNDSLTKVLENVPSTNQYGKGEVDGVIKHFSVYAGSETRKKR
jgi:hypothetical protein